MLGLGGWDWVAIGVYFSIVLGIGIWTARRVSNTSDFFIGGRRFGKVMMVFFSFGAGTSGNDAVGVSSKTYVGGMSGIWFQWLWLFCTPFGCKVRTSVKVTHFIPQTVVSTYVAPGGNPWQEMAAPVDGSLTSTLLNTSPKWLAALALIGFAPSIWKRSERLPAWRIG